MSDRETDVRPDRGRQLDPDLARFVREMGEGWARHGELTGLPPAEMRRIAEAVRAPWARGGPEMAAIREIAVPHGDGSVRVRIHEPDQATGKGALLYLHGGGWTLFSLDTHDRLMREYAFRAGVAVIGIDYALAPEAKYPVALDQVVSVVEFAAAQGAALRIDPRRLAIGGDSAGANLAIATSLRLRDDGKRDLVRGMLFNYGVFDRDSSADARAQFGGEGNMLTADEMEAFWKNYLRDESDAESPYVSPLRADVEGLPSAFFAVAECDLLAEQNLRMAQRLRAGGVPVDLETYRGAPHSFLEAVSISSVADRAIADGAAWLRRLLSSEERPS